MKQVDPHSSIRLIHWLFWRCDDLLRWISSATGLSYEAVNILIFVVVWPTLTIWLAVRVWRRRDVQSLNT